MKNFPNIKIALILAPLFTGSCEKVIDNFDFLEADPKLVVNAPLISDSTIIIHVSHTTGIMDGDFFNYIDNATAGIYSDENFLEEAAYIDSGFYSFGLIPAAGNEYILKVETPGYASVESIIDIPAFPVLTSIEFAGEDENGIRLRVTIKDPEGSINAYGLSLIYPLVYLEFDEYGNITDTIIDGTSKAYLRSKDINVSGGIFDYSLSTEKWDDYSDGSSLLIEDNLVNGREFSFVFSTPDIYLAIALEQAITVQLESFNQDYISYLKSMELYYNSIENPLSEKVSLYTNIEGGLGVAHGKSITKSELIIPPGLISGSYMDWWMY
jgi:hypothetical protein